MRNVRWRQTSLWHENDISNGKDDQDGKEIIGSVEGQRGLHLKQSKPIVRGMPVSLPPFPADRSIQADAKEARCFILFSSMQKLRRDTRNVSSQWPEGSQEHETECEGKGTVWKDWVSRRLDNQSHNSPGKSMTWDMQGAHNHWSLYREGQGSVSSSASGDSRLMSYLPGELSGQWAICCFGWGCSLSILSKLCH